MPKAREVVLDASGPMTDFTVETMRINDKMVICTPEYPIYLTKEQAMAFFDLVPRT